MTHLNVLNLGAGVQSTTVYLMFMQGLITPSLDVAIFADTQEEPEEVYRHLAWLESLGGPPILRVTAGKIGNDLVAGKNSTGQRFASIPAFTTKDGGKTVGITRRQCSREYKTDPIMRAIRRDVIGLKPRRPIPKTIHVTQSFGISLDEGGRARRIMATFAKEHRQSSPRFPLIEQMLTRPDCLTWLHRHGGVPHDTPRSACVFCPYHSDAEWERVKGNPRDWQRAVEVDRALRSPGSVVNRDMKQVLYLHRSCVPLEEVVLNPQPRDRQIPMSFHVECEGVCGN